MSDTTVVSSGIAKEDEAIPSVPEAIKYDSVNLLPESQGSCSEGMECGTEPKDLVEDSSDDDMIDQFISEGMNNGKSDFGDSSSATIDSLVDKQGVPKEINSRSSDQEDQCSMNDCRNVANDCSSNEKSTTVNDIDVKDCESNIEESYNNGGSDAKENEDLELCYDCSEDETTLENTPIGSNVDLVVGENKSGSNINISPGDTVDCKNALGEKSDSKNNGSDYELPKKFNDSTDCPETTNELFPSNENNIPHNSVDNDSSTNILDHNEDRLNNEEDVVQNGISEDEFCSACSQSETESVSLGQEKLDNENDSVIPNKTEEEPLPDKVPPRLQAVRRTSRSRSNSSSSQKSFRDEDGMKNIRSGSPKIESIHSRRLSRKSRGSLDGESEVSDSASAKSAKKSDIDADSSSLKKKWKQKSLVDMQRGDDTCMSSKQDRELQKKSPGRVKKEVSEIKKSRKSLSKHSKMANVEQAIMDVIVRARNGEQFGRIQFEDDDNDLPLSKFARKNQTSPKKRSHLENSSPLNAKKSLSKVLKSPKVNGSPIDGSKKFRGRASWKKQRKQSLDKDSDSMQNHSEKGLNSPIGKAHSGNNKKVIRRQKKGSIGKTSQSPARSVKESPQKRMEDLLKGPGDKSGLAMGKGRKSFSPVTEYKTIGQNKRGPRAKMSLSPNRLSTITIQDFFKPVVSSVTAKSAVAKKTLTYSPRKSKSFSQDSQPGNTKSDQASSKTSLNTGVSNEVNTISSDAATKALAALQTEGTLQKNYSESSDIENNPTVSSLIKKSRMPKARKSFPRSKESSPIETLDRGTKVTLPVPSKSAGGTISSSGPSPTSSSVLMTFKLQELESAFGIKGKSLGKLDAKTLDKIVLDRAQECKKNPVNKTTMEMDSISHHCDEDVEASQVSLINFNTDDDAIVSEHPSSKGAAATAATDPNFASLLTRQRILKKRTKRKMGVYNLPGTKKPKKKKVPTATLR